MEVEKMEIKAKGLTTVSPKGFTTAMVLLPFETSIPTAFMYIAP